ncbi:MAG: hypothetical protein NTZ95_04075 [Candidatus Omnitrophica bacterium]|nr:hypothetical protein [Candidatus Omnitrophota bacterium]
MNKKVNLKIAITNDCAVFMLSNTKEAQNIQNKTRYLILDILFIAIHYSGGDDGEALHEMLSTDVSMSYEN